ncbi:MAG TPA: dihydrolipoamide acetyltransferase family protein [Thermomicrobiaceae bacterium]|nr:dihydrolipoamide acetyltransferase family protein [Thermomicrobiaceae bacterium]
MATVIMPKMGDAMEEGTLLRWLKGEGDEVAQGEPIAEIETDKVNLEIESNDAGVMRKHLVDEGATVPIGEPIAIIAAPGEEVEIPAPASQPQPVAAQPAARPPAAMEAQAPAESAAPGRINAEQAPEALSNNREPAGVSVSAAMPEQVLERAPGERVRASPLVRRLAAEHGIDLSDVRGSGPGGRIVKVDIMPLIGRPATQAAPAEAPAAPAPAPRTAPAAAPTPAAVGAPAGELRELPRIRRTIAKRMSESWQQAPHFFVTMAIGMDKAMALREQINGEIEDRDSQVSVNDLILKASALALRAFPALNASFAGDQLRIHPRIDVAFAVAFEGGLISPVIPETDRTSLGEIARMTKDLARRAREGTIHPEEFQGGTFTVSNLGMFGVDSFTAIINPPQAAILAVGTIATEPVYQDGQFKPVQRMKVTLSVDHRVSDGAEAARFLQEVKRLLEAPMTLLVG